METVNQNFIIKSSSFEDKKCYERRKTKLLFILTITILVILIPLIIIIIHASKPDATSNTSTSKQPNPPNWPSSVHIFDASSDDINTIQQIVNNISSNTEFSNNRYALLFKPGNYDNLQINVSYYTSIIGLGSTPQQVEIPNIISHNGKAGALDNFWRSVENIYTKPTMQWNGDRTTMLWAVSQASPMRRVYIDGNLDLWQGDGYSSGGYISNSHVSGTITSGSQQQFYLRNVNMSSWVGGAWNMVFQGSINVPETECPGKYTTISETDIIAEKPFIMITDDGLYKLVIPGIETNKIGASCIDFASENRQIIDFSLVYVTNPEIDNAQSINSALRNGIKYVVITPGLYYLETSIQVISAGTVILGIGFPSLIPTNGNAVIEIGINGENVDGVRIGGLLLEAGDATNCRSVIHCDTLLRFGMIRNGNVSAKNPAILYDIFSRVGGSNNNSEIEVNSNSMMQINSNNVIIDNGWLWRADHDIAGLVTDSNNYGEVGLEVNGDNVICYGLAVEHALGDLVQWNGENGKVYFYQSELPYDVTQENYGNRGYVGFRIKDDVNRFEGYGMGIYSYFRDYEVRVENGIKSPKNKTDVKIVNAFTKYLNGKGAILSVINGVGDTVGATVDGINWEPAYVCSYPS